MKITLCGSTRFKKEFELANERLTLAGHVVYSVAFFGHARAEPLDPWAKQRLDLVHLAKILASDHVVVVGSLDGCAPYVGESTRREIFWAEMNGRGVGYSLTGRELDAFADYGKKMDEYIAGATS